MQENELSSEEFVKMMEEEAKVELLNSFKPELLKYLPNYLRLIGKYDKILKRAIDKQRILESNFMTSTDLPDLALTYDELIKWFFEKRLDIPLIEDIEKYVKDMGFSNKNELLRMLKREYHYLKKLEENQKHIPLND
jgi:hypothetical protein